MAVYSIRSNMELIGYPDCQALTESGECRWLDMKHCIGEECSFMKSRLAVKTDEQRAYARLATLDEGTQQRISMKYYRGARPWLQASASGESGEMGNSSASSRARLRKWSSAPVVGKSGKDA